mgnify:CR=1 FL=1
MTSTKFVAALAAGLLTLGACGSVSNDSDEATTEGAGTSELGDDSLSSSEGSESGTADDSSINVLRDGDEGEDAEYTVEVTVPEDWYEADKVGFDYQYLWSGNDWDDVLAQDFSGTEYEFSGNFFIDLLEDNLAADANITLRDESAELAGYPAIIIDVTYATESYTSLTYVDVAGHLWEFTVNAQTLEGIERGEAIIATAEFTG